jgi:osmotically-inducible protein OsmY
MVKRWLWVALMGMALSGCVEGALVAGTATGGVMAASGRSFKTIADDETITYRASRAIAQDKVLAASSRIKVIVFNHSVLLIGETPKPEWRAQAEQAVQGVAGINHIYNKISIGEPIDASVQGNDGLITTNAKTRMLSTTNLRAREIKVITENGIVYLLGMTTHKQAEIAVEVVRNSTGVKKIVKVFEYID